MSFNLIFKTNNSISKTQHNTERIFLLISVTYWAAGGLGSCKLCDDVCVQEENKSDNGGCIKNEECIIKEIDGEQNICYNYIYPITDWGNHPGLATVTVFIGVILLPICHLIWFGIYKLRTRIHEKIRHKNINKRNSQTTIQNGYI